METLTCAIIGHLVGDYLLQNDWMACNKKKGGKEGGMALAIHCLIWTSCVQFFAGWFPDWKVFVVLYIAHSIQDGTNIIYWWMTLRWKDQSRFMECDDFDLTDMRVVPGLGPWSIIVVDNVWHIVTIWVVWKFII